VWKIIESNKMGKGIPIGNLTSQLFANIYLNELDYEAQFNIGAKKYVRYMDDIIVVTKTKKELWSAYEAMRVKCEQTLLLSFKESSPQIVSYKNGIHFLGYVLFRSYRGLRKSTIRRMLKKAKKKLDAYNSGTLSSQSFINGIASFDGHMSHANAWQIRSRLRSFAFEKQA
jgi:RNA-directed DNA polymerase